MKGEETRTSELKPRENAVDGAVKVRVLGQRYQSAFHVANGFEPEAAAFGIVPCTALFR